MTRVKAESPPSDPAEYIKWLRAGRGGVPVAGLHRLSDITSEKVSWLWPGRIPRRKLTVIDGDPGVGKSTVTCDLAARVSTGRDWPDGHKGSRPAGVLMLTAEDGLADTVRPRIERASGDLSRVLVLETVPGADGSPRPPSLPADLDVITAIIKSRGIKLVTIDVLNSYLGGTVDSYRDQDIRRALHPLARMAEQTGAAIVALRHLNKAAAISNALYRGGGSIGIAGQARAVHLCAPDPDDASGKRAVFAPVKVNVGAKAAPLAYHITGDTPDAPSYIEWLGSDPHSASELLGMTLDAEDRADRDEVVWWLTDYLEANGGEAPFHDILSASRKHGIAERTLKRARDRAGIRYVRKGWASGTIWQLPGESSGPSGPSGPQSE